MKILTCFLPPSGGTATIAGHDIIKEPLKVRSHIGYMPENVPLYKEMRVREYLSFRARIKDVARSKRRNQVEEVMERCWLSHVARQTIGTLSKGYRQRVGLADAMVSDPDLLILDEPTIGLDPNQVRQVRALIHDLGRDHTVLISTHILPEVEIICDRVIIINEGRIAVQDSVENLRRGSGKELEYYLEVKGSAEDLRGTLASVEGVRDLAEHTAHVAGEGVRAFVFKADRDSGTAERVAAAVASRGSGLRELRRRERTLEDVFVEIVTREQNSTG